MCHYHGTCTNYVLKRRVGTGWMKVELWPGQLQGLKQRLSESIFKVE